MIVTRDSSDAHEINTKTIALFEHKCWTTNVTLARGDDKHVKAHRPSSAREYPITLSRDRNTKAKESDPNHKHVGKLTLQI